VPAPKEPLGLRPLPRAALELILLVGAAALLVVALLKLRLVVLPVVLALFLTTALHPLHRRLVLRGVPSWLAALGTILSALLLLVLLFAVLIPPVVNEAGDVGDTARDGIDEIVDWLEDGPLAVDRDELDDGLDRAIDAVRENAGGIGQGVLTAGTLALEVVAGLLLILVLTFYFLHDGDRIWRWILSLSPSDRRDSVHAFGLDVITALGGYLRGVLFVATVDALLIGAGLFALGVPLVAPLAVLTFLAAFIPLAGAFVAGALAALVALVTEGVVDAVLVVVLVTVVQQVEGNLLYPIVVGRSAELHPVAILLSVLTGAVLYGIVGAALAVPVAAIVWAAIRRFRREEVVADTGIILVEAPEP
jgi:putative heme transporter